jgi:hypothetical protein
MHRIAIVALSLGILVMVPVSGGAQQTTAPAGDSKPSTGTSQSSTKKTPSDYGQKDDPGSEFQKGGLKKSPKEKEATTPMPTPKR